MAYVVMAPEETVQLMQVLCACRYARLLACRYTCPNTFLFLHIRGDGAAHAGTVQLSIHMRIHMHTHIPAHMSLYTRLHTCLYTCLRACL